MRQSLLPSVGPSSARPSHWITPSQSYPPVTTRADLHSTNHGSRHSSRGMSLCAEIQDLVSAQDQEMDRRSSGPEHGVALSVGVPRPCRAFPSIARKRGRWPARTQVREGMRTGNIYNFGPWGRPSPRSSSLVIGRSARAQDTQARGNVFSSSRLEVTEWANQKRCSLNTKHRGVEPHPEWPFLCFLLCEPTIQGAITATA